MKNDEIRSNRLNYLLRIYLKNGNDNELFRRAKMMGVSDVTAKDYVRTVKIQAEKTRKK